VMKREKKENKKHRFRIGSIQSIITISFTLIFVLAMLFVSLSMFSSFSENAETNAAASARQILGQAAINVENYLETMMQISDLIHDNLEKTSVENVQEIKGMLSLTISMRSDIVTVAVFSESGNVFFTNPEYTCNRNYVVREQDWFKETLDNPDTYLFQPPHVQRLFDEWRPWVVSLCRTLDVEYLDSRETWVAMVDMNFSEIEQLCGQVSLGQRGYIYLVDQQGTIIYHPQQQLIYSGLKEENVEHVLGKEEGSFIDNHNGERRITTIQTIKHSNWKMIGVSYVDELVENRHEFTRFIIFVIAFAILFIVGATVAISFKISQPIKRLEHQMNRVERGDFNIEALEVKGEDEVKRLTKAFNLMIARIKQLMGQIISVQEAKRKSEFKALQAQINPHFLYNTLDSIIWMNENQNYDGVSQMTAALAKFFRISISKGNELIDVADEIEHAASYLVIQKIRYKNKFDYTFEVSEEAKQYKTLKLILQPIIENAIYHGVGKIQDKGEIAIKVFVDGSNLVYQVSDNGYGIKPARLNEILKTEQVKKRTSGVGMKNVNERIHLSFGNKYGVSIESELEVGTTVTIRVPVIEGESDG